MFPAACHKPSSSSTFFPPFFPFLSSKIHKKKKPSTSLLLSPESPTHTPTHRPTPSKTSTRFWRFFTDQSRSMDDRIQWPTILCLFFFFLFFFLILNNRNVNFWNNYYNYDQIMHLLPLFSHFSVIFLCISWRQYQRYQILIKLSFQWN